MSGEITLEELDFGTTIYDGDGRELGRIRGFDEHGFYVSLREGLDGLSSQHVRSGGTFGEAELMWRCWNCGEIGQIDDALPDRCPNCDTRKEDLYYWTED